MVQDKIRGSIFISNVLKAMEHEWFADMVDQKKLTLQFVLFNSKDSEVYHYLTQKGFSVKNHSLRSKLQIPYYVILYWIKLLFKRPDFVHCHLFEASLIGLAAAKCAGVRKRISTRHHSDFHHLYHPHAVKYDLLVDYLSTHIIAVSEHVAEILVQKEKVNPNKIKIIPHGIPLKVMDEVISVERINTVRKRYKFENNSPVIGVISRFVEWKGVQYIIPAFKKLLQDYPDAKLVLANAEGNYKNEIRNLLATLPNTNYICIPFENDGQALLKSFDVFVHVPIDKKSEAFGQVYIECLAYKVPMACTLSGIATKLIRDGENALVVGYKDKNSIYESLKKLLQDEGLRKKTVEQGKLDVRNYSFEHKFEQIMEVYYS